MSFNYRVIEDDGFFAVTEVFYDEEGKHHSFVEIECSEWHESLDDLELSLKRQTEATYKKVLNIQDFIEDEDYDNQV